MRMYMPLALLVCSFTAIFSVTQDSESMPLDTYDYNQLWSVSRSVLEHFKDRIEPADEQGEIARLVPNDNNELTALTVATAYAWLAFVRMHQEAACLLEQENAKRILQEVWDEVNVMCSIMPEQIVEISMGLVKQLLELSAGAEDQWKPSQNHEKYIPASEWKSVRLEVAAQYCQGFDKVLASGD